MKKRSNFKSLGFVFIYTALFLLLAVNNTSFYFAKSIKNNKKAQTQSTTGQSSEEKDDTKPEELILQAFSIEAVVPLTILTLGYLSHFIFSISFPTGSELKVFYEFVPSIPPALENTFENHIAINAP
jgi:H+/gluconate symporter-like permease